MKQRTNKIEELYENLKREITDISIYKLVIAEDKIPIDYEVPYQRNYIWNDTKAINLIETILINGVIPPIIALQTSSDLKIIDGRQRLETILKFHNNEFPLKQFGLDVFKGCDNCFYKDLPNNMKTIFEEYKIKFIIYQPNKMLTTEDIDLVQRDLFKRANLGMTSLTRSEVARAKYLYDFLTNKFVNLFEKDPAFYQNCIDILLPINKREIDNREKINLLLISIRESLIMYYIPIIGENTIRVGFSVFDKYYSTFISPLTEKEKISKLNESIKILQKIYLIKQKLIESDDNLKDNVLFFKCLYWMFAILYTEDPNGFYNFDINQFYHYIKTSGANYFSNYKNMSSDHVANRYHYVKTYLTDILKLDITQYLKKTKQNKYIISQQFLSTTPKDDTWSKIGPYKQVMTNDDTLEVDEIIRLIKQNRFIIRSDYQRAEVKSKKKASRIIESILLGIKLPPLYLYVTRNDDYIDRYTVLDGQQRLISVLKFMGENITDSNYNYISSSKEKFALTGLKDMFGLNGMMYNDEKRGLNPIKQKIIKNYKFDVVKIDKQANPKFDSVDMFLRLNQNPCPISSNSFELWNSFDIVETLSKIKLIAKNDLFKQSGKRMKEEELVTTLAYMDYAGANIKNINKFFHIYLYTENSNKQFEHTEVRLSVKNKDKLSNFLEDLEPNSPKDIAFQNYLDNVTLFTEKLKILCNNDNSILIKIFNPNLSKPQIGNKKDFYLTWLILHDIDFHVIKTYRESILVDLEKLFKRMKNMPQSSDVLSFLDCVKDIIEKYEKFSSNIS